MTTNAERYRQQHIDISELIDRLSNNDKLRLAQAFNEGWEVGDFGADGYDPEPVDKVLAKIKVADAPVGPRYTTSWDPAAQTFIFDGDDSLTMGQIIERLNSQQNEIDRLADLPKTKDGVPVTPGMMLITVHPKTGEWWGLEVMLMGKEYFMYGWPHHGRTIRYEECWSSTPAAEAAKRADDVNLD